MSKKQTVGYKSDVLNSKGVKLGELGTQFLAPRSFSTGSVGLNHNGKVSIGTGDARHLFQVSLNVTLAHSKDGDAKRVDEAVRNGFLALKPLTLTQMGLLDAVAEPHAFTSGKVGYYYSGKTLINGSICQVGCSITAIGSETWADKPVDVVAEVEAILAE